MAPHRLADLFLLLVTRALLGIAVGGVMTVVSATITDWFDGPRRASFLGLQQAFASLGGVVFLPLAGALATIGWRVLFWLYGLAAVVALFAILAVRDRPRDTPAVAAGRGRAVLPVVSAGTPAAAWMLCKSSTTRLGSDNRPRLSRACQRSRSWIVWSVPSSRHVAK